MPVSRCCYEHAREAGSVFCGECGSWLLRCMAHAECGGMLDADGLCDVCVRPALFLDAGAALDVKTGGAQVLPLVFANASPMRRPLFITQVWVREGQGERRPVELAWERLEQGASNPLWVQTGAMQTTGRYRVELAFAAATRFKRREEQFAFVSNLELSVEQGGSLVINQTINTSGTGGGSDTIYAPIRLEGALDNNPKAAAATGPAPLAVVRAERLERSMGLRGYDSGPLANALVSRAARFAWKGFPSDEAPGAGPIATEDGTISMGRSNVRSAGGEGDVRLLVRDSAGGLDENLSRAISRRHVDLFVQGGKLWLEAAGEAGVMIGDRRLSVGASAALESGDIVRVLPKYPDAIAFQVQMRAHHGLVEDVTITRIPPLPEG